MMLRDGLIHNYNKNDKRQLPIGKNKKVPGLFKDELGGKIIIEVIALRPKTYAYLMDDGSNHKKAKGTKKCVIKQKFMFENYKERLFKACVCYFLSNFYFSPNDSPSKTIKNAFYFI